MVFPYSNIISSSYTNYYSPILRIKSLHEMQWHFMKPFLNKTHFDIDMPVFNNHFSFLFITAFMKIDYICLLLLFW